MTKNLPFFLFLFIGSFFSVLASAQAWQWGAGSTGAQLEGRAVTTDRSGNVYVAGFGSDGGVSGTQVVTVGTYTVNASDVVAVIIKYDPSGNILWVKSIPDVDVIAMTTDQNSNLLIFGAFLCPSLQWGTYTLTNTAPASIAPYYILKIDPSGNAVWGKCGGGTHEYSFPIGTAGAILNSFGGITVDDTGNVYVASDYNAPVITVGTYTLTNTDPLGYTDDIMVAKYDSSGNVLWAASGGGAKYDDASGIAVTPAGDVYITGVIESPTASFGAFTVTNANPGHQNTFVTRYNSSGVPVWAVTSGGTTDDYAAGIAADGLNNVYIVGGTDVDITFSGTTITDPYAGNSVLYMVQFNSSNNVGWYKALGSPTGGTIWGYAVAIAPCSNIVWATGSFSDEVSIDGTVLNIPASSVDPVFIAGFNPSGVYQASAGLQSGADDQNDIACDPSGNVFMGGDYAWPCAPFKVGPAILPTVTADGSEWLFVAKYAAPPPLPDTVFNSHDTSLCNIAAMVLYAPAGCTSYLWNNGSTGAYISIDDTGTYRVTGYGAGTCAVSIVIDTYKVALKNVDLAFSLGPDTTACSPITLSVPLTNVSCLWQNGSTAASYTATQPGSYYVTISEDGCTNSDTINIRVYNLTQNLRDTTLCRETFSAYTLSANVPNGGSALWNTGSTQPSINVTDTGRYSVTVTDAGCTTSDSMLLQIQLCHCEAVLPSAFTPNDDGKNDHYYPVFEAGCIVNSYTFSIYNRWGQRIFYSEDPATQWDGTFDGIKADVGVYMYYLRYNSGFDDILHTAKGDVTLIR